MVKIDFRGLIKREMKKQQVNTPELARRTNLNAQTIYNYLAGKTGRLYLLTIRRERIQ